ncbi:Ribonuclease H-like domain [Lasallia pustulata]|uniref:Ribonuclease H-like domain n=1 Tax=Lasallia pustulata TaxID=136370 RepID=A0A1W5CR33_9LECA|nr:Ribonuclease H-like domain [Lasallia pustulata]
MKKRPSEKFKAKKDKGRKRSAAKESDSPAGMMVFSGDEISETLDLGSFCFMAGQNGNGSLAQLAILRMKGQVFFDKDKASIIHPEYTLLAPLQHGLFLLNIWDPPTLARLAAYAISNLSAIVWHQGLTHLGEQNIKKLKMMSIGIKPVNPGTIYHHCLEGKLKECPHRKHFAPGTYYMEFIHTDIGRPFPVTGHEGQRYWVTFLDDYTKDAEVIAITTKEKIFIVFKRFLEHNKRPENRCHRVHLDNSGEARLMEFREICMDRGIELEITATEQHKQNGVAERLNGNIMEKFHLMLLNAKLPKKYWPEVLKAIVYIRRRCASAMLGMTLYEKCYGTKPDLAHLRIIGAYGYILKLSSKRRKLIDTKSKQCILLGYSGGSLYVVLKEDGKIIRTNNIIFNEQKNMLETHELSSQPPVPVDIEDRHVLYNLPPGSNVIPAALPKSQKRSRAENLLDAPNVDAGEKMHNLMELEPLDDESSSAAQKRQVNPTPEGNVHTVTNHPGVLRISSQRTKGQHPHRWAMLGALISTAVDTASPFEPKTLGEAQTNPSWECWNAAMAEEKQSLDDNHTWNVVNKPEHREVLRGKWVFKHKRGVNGEIIWYKACWVVRGFEQKEGIDYNETFASVVKPMSYKAIFAIATALDLYMEQMDIKTAFLYGDINEEIYVEQPNGLDQIPGKFHELSSDLGVFTRGNYYIAVYVDDLLFVGPKKSEIKKVKQSFNKCFKMTDLGPCSYYLDMSVRRDLVNRALFLGQHAYLDKVIRDFGMAECKPVSLLMDPNIKLQAMLADYELPPADLHWYTSCIGSLMGDLRSLIGYTDANWAGDIDTQRSTSGYLLMLEAVQSAATKEVMWLRQLLNELVDQGEPNATIIYGDNQGALALTKNPTHYGRTKHIDIQHHFVWEKQAAGKLDLRYVPTAEQLADGLTKALLGEAFQHFQIGLGLEEQ